MRDVLSLLVAGATALALLNGLRPLAHRIGLLDSPDTRKTHAGDVPLVGGLAMFFGFAMGALTLDVTLAELRPFFAACALLVMVGVLDDLHELSSRARFAAQILAASMMVGWGGVLLGDLGAIAPGGAIFTLGVAAVPFSVFCTVGVINALNMSDGVDGLAGGFALVALAGLAWIAHDSGLQVHLRVLLLLSVVVLAFLWLNARMPWRPRALVFMGDAGSMFLGFAITWFVIDLSQGPAAPMAPVVALWLLLVPLFDTVFLLLRRPLTGHWPTAASHDHLHHVLQMAGLGAGATMALLWALAALAAVAALAASAAGVAERYLFWTFIMLFVCYATVMGVAWRRRRLLGRPLDRRLGDADRRRPGERRQGDRRQGGERRGGEGRRENS